MKALLVYKSKKNVVAAIRRTPLHFVVGLLVAVLGIGAAQAQFNAYVASAGNTRVLKLDPATNTADPGVAITGTGSRHLSFSRDGARLYSVSSNAAQVIDVATNTVTASIATGNIVTNVVEAANGFLYTCNNASGTVSIIDPATYTVASTLTSMFCQSVAVTPDGSSVWVSINEPVNFFPAVAVIDPSTNTVATTFNIGAVRANAASWIAFTPDGAHAYASGFPSNSVTVIDTATQTTVATIPVGSLPTFAAASPDGAYVYTANLTGNSVSVIDTTTNTVVATVAVGTFPRAIAFTPDSASAYVTNFNSSSISVIDTATKTVSSTFAFGSRPWGIAFGKAPNVAPVLASDQASVAVNETQTATNFGTVTDANNDTVSLSASVGSVANNGDGTWSWSYLTSDGPTQSQTVTITGDDGQGGTSTTTFSLVVDNVAPTLTSISNDGPIVIGGSATITVAASDVAGDADPLAYSFDCDNNGSFEIGPQSGNSAACTFATAGSKTVNVNVSDGDGGVATGSTVVTVNHAAPICSGATASPNALWPPNHKFVAIKVLGVTNPEGGTIAIKVTRIFQDEKVGSGKGDDCEDDDDDHHGQGDDLFLIGNSNEGNSQVDGKGVGTASASVRAERACNGNGNGRVYHISFTATNAFGLTCTGEVKVGVARRKNVAPIDGGSLYDSTIPVPVHGGHGDRD